MSKRLQVYETDQVRVTFDPTVCIHSGTCLRTLPAVFDVARKRWIRPELAAPGDVIDAVAKCPSGALKASLVTAVHPALGDPAPQGADASAAPEEPVVVITVRDHGSLLVEGRYRVVAPDGTVLREGTKCGLCRCGASKTKPFCDGSHREIGF